MTMPSRARREVQDLERMCRREHPPPPFPRTPPPPHPQRQATWLVPGEAGPPELASSTHEAPSAHAPRAALRARAEQPLPPPNVGGVRPH